MGRGFLMGGADIIPGVSGGTVALILGIYERLIAAISHCDVKLLQLLAARKFGQAIEHADLRFLVCLGAGIGLGIVSLAGLMHELLLNQRMLTFSAFFGLIAASSWLVGMMVPRWRVQEVASLLLGAVFAFYLVGLPLIEQPPGTLTYLFFCGVIAICAMILPGISGAFILLLLGKYVEVTGMIKGAIHGEISAEIVIAVGVFCSGCLIGLLSFSRLLRWLLANHHNVTMAVLCGFMIGSLRKLFPFQTDLTPDVTELKHKLYENRALSSINIEQELFPAIAVALLAASFVMILNTLSEVTHASEKISDASEG